MSVAEHLKTLNMRINEACVQVGRPAQSVRLLAVSKLQPINAIREAYDCGQNDFAENYVQEALEKLEQLRSLPVRWHFIGRIQSNKVKHLVKRFAVIHSVDRTSVVEALNRLSREADVTQDIFVQYNVAQEKSKGGAADEAALKHLFTQLEGCQNLRVLGLMVMPPLSEDPEMARPFFRQANGVLTQLRQRLGNDPRFPLRDLSMGTSHDFPIAIAEGATVIRVGTEAFGPRPSPKKE